MNSDVAYVPHNTALSGSACLSKDAQKIQRHKLDDFDT